MGYLSLFVKDMTAGRGFIALAAVYLGGRTPAGVMYASLLFGLADALANQLGSLNIPPQVVLAIPYVVTVVALVVHNVRVENAKGGKEKPGCCVRRKQSIPDEVVYERRDSKGCLAGRHSAA